jgi:hypothetical protein
VKPATKAARQRQSAERIAELMYAALKKLPEKEQSAAIKAVQKIKINTNRSTSKCFSNYLP